jgi:hypothetical protein
VIPDLQVQKLVDDRLSPEVLGLLEEGGVERKAGLW